MQKFFNMKKNNQNFNKILNIFSHGLKNSIIYKIQTPKIKIIHKNNINNAHGNLNING